MTPESKERETLHYGLRDLLDLPVLQKLLEHFNSITGMVTAILDPDGEILLTVGWQDICAKFHRICPQTECRCRQSDNYLKEHLHKNPYILYKCLNGLMDCAIPIMIDNYHLGTLFTGQFLPEPPDEEFFLQQAQEFGFDESAYIDALRRVPVISEDRLESIMSFYSQLSQILSTMSLQRIDQLEAADEKFKESEERLRLALEGSNSGYWDWNFKTKVFYYSPGWHKMLGYSPGDIEPSFEAWNELIHEDDRSTVLKRVRDHIQGKTSQYEAEYRLLNKSGQWQWVLGRGKLVARDRNGQALRVTGVATDITERVWAEQQLQEERNFNAALLDTAGNLILVCDQNGRIIRFNQVCEQVTGYTFDEVKGKLIWETVVAPDSIPNVTAIFNKSQNSFKSQDLKRNFESHWVTKDGKHRLISWTISFLFSTNYSTYHVIGSGTDITHQRIMEERIRESETELRSIFENANGIIYGLSHEGHFTFVSPGWTETLGHDVSEVVDSSFELFVHPDDIQSCWSFIKKVFTTGIPQRGIEYRIRHKDGSWHWNTSSGATFKDRAGNSLYYVGIATDITERKQIEKTLKESENKFSKAFHANPESLTISSIKQNRLVEVNDAFLQCFGYEQNEVIGHSILDLDIWHNPEERDLIIKNVKEHGGIRSFETKFRMKSGEIRTFLLSADIIDLDGDPYLLCIAKDITERKQIQDALEESERRFREMLENIKLVAGIMDDQTRITYCNDYFLQLLGWNKDEVIGRDWFDTFVPLEVRDRDKRIVTRSLEKRIAPAFGESEIQTRSGERRTILWSNTLLLNPDGSPSGFAGIGEDVTEHRAAEKRSRELMEELTSTNRELKDFAYIISHDLKAPLRGIRSLAEWLYSDYRDKFDEIGQEQLEMLLNRTTRMHNLLEGILRYSRLSNSDEEKAAINLNEVLTEVIEMLAPPGNIKITIEDNMPVLMLERTRIQELFENLISNAIKCMDKPNGQISISCKNSADYWQFNVKDNGSGIDAKYFDKIFTIFQTLKARDEYESTGIGLTIVKKIVEIYGGKVWVESEVGNGSTFSFTLPTSQNSLWRVNRA